jgi:hypothetical protein
MLEKNRKYRNTERRVPTTENLRRQLKDETIFKGCNITFRKKKLKKLGFKRWKTA